MTPPTLLRMPPDMYPVHLYHPRFDSLDFWFPAKDACVLDALCRQVNCDDAMEIGTFVGTTASILARHFRRVVGHTPAGVAKLTDLGLARAAAARGDQVDDLVHVEPELAQDLIAVLVELGGAARDGLDLDAIDPALADRAKMMIVNYPNNPIGATADRDFFQVHQTRADRGLFISAPWVTPDGEYLISLSRRISTEDGSFAGVVAGSMRLSYFHNLFRKLNFGLGDSMGLIAGG